MPEPRGPFIVLDGPDGAGKTTQARLLRSWLADAHGIETVVVREPGGTPLGEEVRRILLDPAHGDMTAQGELLLYMASRSQLVHAVVRPALDAGRAVVADRYLSASVAYQGVGMKLGVQTVLDIGRFATGGLDPDLLLLLDLEPEEGLARGRLVRDRIEARDLHYHRAVRDGFLALGDVYPGRVHVLDATGSVDEVHRRIRERVDALLAARRPPPGPED